LTSNPEQEELSNSEVGILEDNSEEVSVIENSSIVLKRENIVLNILFLNMSGLKIS